MTNPNCRMSDFMPDDNTELSYEQGVAVMDKLRDAQRANDQKEFQKVAERLEAQYLDELREAVQKGWSTKETQEGYAKRMAMIRESYGL